VRECPLMSLAAKGFRIWGVVSDNRGVDEPRGARELSRHRSCGVGGGSCRSVDSPLHCVGVPCVSGSGDSAPTRTCPCPFVATPWTFAFWAPEAVLLGGLVVAVVARRYAGPVAMGSVAIGFVALGVVAALYGEDIKRMWSLP
jgi:hypothetical protein